MQPDLPAARAWLRRAKPELIAAGSGLSPGLIYEIPCFHAQQAAEMALKGLLASLGIDPPRTHSIEALIDQLPPHLATAPELARAPKLTTFAVERQYFLEEPVTSREEYEEALSIARQVVTWVERQLPPA